jgi:hypothetical protein
VGNAGDRDTLLLHRLQEGRLRLRCGPINLIRQDNLGEDRAALKLEVLATGLVFHDHVGADDVRRHQIRSELDA